MPDFIYWNPTPRAPREVGGHTVYTRAHWADEWFARPDLHCLEAAWSCAPTMPTATLTWHYGSIRQIYSRTFEAVQKLEYLNRAFVKITFQIQRDPDTNNWITRDWYGVIEIGEDQLGGAVDEVGRKVATGEQTFACYGMERFLAEQYVTISYIRRAAAAEGIYRGLTFNRDAKPNRSVDKIDGAYVFEPNARAAKFWSSNDMVEYLLKYQLPRDSLTADLRVPWTFDEGFIPTWDRDELDTHHQTVYSLLDRIVNRKRCLIWHTACDGATCTIKTQSIVPDLIAPLPGKVIFGNSRQRVYNFDEDQMTSAVVKSSGVELCDQVLVRGARVRCVGSFSHKDGTLENGWTAAQELAYEAGASAQPGYAALGLDEKRRLNEEVRQHHKLEPVYSLFQIPKTFAGKVKDGEAGAEMPLFVSPRFDGAWQAFYPDLQTQASLPLLLGVDYTGDKIKNGTYVEADAIVGEESPPLVVFKLPDTTPPRWILCDKIGCTSGEHPHTKSGHNNLMSCHLHVPHHKPGIAVRVTGQAQHAIAKTEFNPLPVDVACGSFDYYLGGMIATFCMESDLFAEAVWPTIPAAPFDCQRVKLIDAGDAFKIAYVAPGTVLGVDEAGALQRSTGGFYPKPNDDGAQAQLLAQAKMAAGWYCIEHKVLTIETRRLRIPAEVELTDLITEIGDVNIPGGHHQVVNAPITEIKVSTPRGSADAGDQSEPVMLITTWAGELDHFSHYPKDVSAPKRDTRDGADAGDGRVYYGGVAMKREHVPGGDARSEWSDGAAFESVQTTEDQVEYREDQVEFGPGDIEEYR